jgi:hypothetical protein
LVEHILGKDEVMGSSPISSSSKLSGEGRAVDSLPKSIAASNFVAWQAGSMVAKDGRRSEIWCVPIALFLNWFLQRLAAEWFRIGE